ncbi:MAG: chemoreceptor glutamine deamidase CheD [Devosiaceae bacterium]|nr:chemoreceptor glutamine deamidase CheD [Devosiaceae bacterium]
MSALGARVSNGLRSDEGREKTVTVNQGGCEVSADQRVTMATVLGSCISACVRDSVAAIGGMNHFLLADQSGSAKDRYGASARYGAFAMEQLINSVLSQGTGRKGNLVIKVFGGGNINSLQADVGARNVEFVRDFLLGEGYEIASEDLGGNFARRIMFKPASGRVFVKRLDSDAGKTVVREELAIAKKRVVAPPVDDIELF